MARCGSPAAYRLPGAWAKTSHVPVRVRFTFAAQHDAAHITAHMTSNHGRGHLAMTSAAHLHHRMRLDQLIVDLQRAGITPTKPTHQP